MSDLSTTIGFVHQAQPSELDAIMNAVRLRHKAIGHERAASLAVGDVVTLTGLSPKALNGLRGAIERFNTGRSRVDLTLDENSTRELAWGRSRFAIAASGVTNYLLSGIPTTCCVKEPE